MTGQPAAPLLSVDQLTKHFQTHRLFQRRHTIHATCCASFELASGETLGVVGESGSGKTTLLRTMLGLYEPTGGAVRFEGQPLDYRDHEARRSFWRRIGVVFQDPYSSLDPRMTVSDLLREPLAVTGAKIDPKQRIRDVLDEVRLPQGVLGRFPHEFSGGQRQRIAIARALMLKPELIALDEPVSSLDVTIQAEILELLADIQRETRTAYILISHDLAVVAQTCHAVIVMYGGQIVEAGPTATVIATPQHPYTQELLASVPSPDPASERARIKRRRELFSATEERTWSLPPCPFDHPPGSPDGDGGVISPGRPTRRRCRPAPERSARGGGRCRRGR
ncbi:MAG: ATP-binding cassette domain-containing protein [Propionibacteriaceae bacterium]|jgi:ABC-type glutathione transport system ATPase component|nr:ATP-binding cassette domain-containing protein [Propionibacteriaceae bacterium]